MPSPNRVMVGTPAIITQDGPGWFTLPFEDKGDTNSFEYHINCTQLASAHIGLQNYRDPITNVEVMEATSTPRGLAYLVLEAEPQPMGRLAWLRFKRTYASVPRTRYEAASITYPIQILSTNVSYSFEIPPEAPEIGELPVSINARIKYEYSLSPLTQLYAPKATALWGLIFKFGGWPTFATEFLAEDSTQGIYKGGIYFRRSVLILSTPFTT